MNALTTQASRFGTLALATVNGTSGLVRRSPLAELISKIAYPTFKASTSSFLFGFGSLELTSAAKNAVHLQKRDDVSSKVFLNTHGGLLALSGLCGLLETLELLGIAAFGSIGTALFNAGHVLFLGANIIALEENVRLFETTSANRGTGEANALLKRSAIAGMISNIGYIFATSVFLLGGPAGIALGIGAISATSGGLKILYDLMLWRNEQLQNQTIGRSMQENQHLL